MTPAINRQTIESLYERLDHIVDVFDHPAEQQFLWTLNPFFCNLFHPLNF